MIEALIVGGVVLGVTWIVASLSKKERRPKPPRAPHVLPPMAPPPRVAPPAPAKPPAPTPPTNRVAETIAALARMGIRATREDLAAIPPGASEDAVVGIFRTRDALAAMGIRTTIAELVELTRTHPDATEEQITAILRARRAAEAAPPVQPTRDVTAAVEQARRGTGTSETLGQAAQSAANQGLPQTAQALADASQRAAEREAGLPPTPALPAETPTPTPPPAERRWEWTGDPGRFRTASEWRQVLDLIAERNAWASLQTRGDPDLASLLLIARESGQGEHAVATWIESVLLSRQRAREAPAAPPPPAPTPGRVPPAGYDFEAAKVLAVRLVANLIANPMRRTDAGLVSNYSRTMTKQFQTAAGIPIDVGLYGGGTRGALVYFLAQARDARTPPRPYFRPVETVPYQPYSGAPGAVAGWGY